MEKSERVRREAKEMDERGWVLSGLRGEADGQRQNQDKGKERQG